MLAVPFPIKISANMKCLARLSNKAEASDKISDSQKEVLTEEAPEDQEVDLVEAEDKILKMETMTTSIIKKKRTQFLQNDNQEYKIHTLVVPSKLLSLD